MSDDTRESRVEVATQAAEVGAEIALDSYRSDHDIDYKDGKTDAVTQADRDAQTAVIEAIEAEYPEETIVGEEEGTPKEVPESGPAWIVDPIDGTNNYVRGIPVFGTAIGVVRDGDPIAGASIFPALSDHYRSGHDDALHNGEPISVSTVADPELATLSPTFWWDRDRRAEYAVACREIVERFDDMRRFGCGQATLAMVASGALEGTISNVYAHPWDTVAGVHMIREAGGRVTDLEGEPWRHDSWGLVATNGADAIHEEALAATRAIEAEREIDTGR